VEYSKKCNIKLFNFRKRHRGNNRQWIYGSRSRSTINNRSSEKLYGYIILNRATLIAVRKLEAIVNSDGLIHVELFKHIMTLAAQNEQLVRHVANQAILKAQVLSLQTDLVRVMEVVINQVQK
jgi:hypothetical protein